MLHFGARCALFLTLVALGLDAHAGPYRNGQTWGIDYRLSTGSFGAEHTLFSDRSLDFAWLRKRLETENILSIDGLLVSLARDPRASAFLRSGVLVHTSHSLQAPSTSALYPRVILHLDHLALAFTGNPNRPGYQRLEVMGYDSREARFHFYQIDFRKTGRKITEPLKCGRCHGYETSLRPVWESYDLWPGSYGSFEDKVAFSAAERTRFAHFVRAATDEQDATHARYRRLHLLETWQVDEKKVVNGSARSLRRLPNQGLFAHLSALNFHRVRKSLEREGLLHRNRYALLGAFLPDCGPFQAFLPDGFPHDSEERLAGDTARRQLAEYSERVTRYNRLNGTSLTPDDTEPGMPEVAATDVVARLRVLLEGQGSSLEDWSLSFLPDGSSEPEPTYAFGMADSARSTLYALFRQELLPPLLEEAPGVFDLAYEPMGTSPVIQFWHPDAEKRLCSELQARSRLALSSLTSRDPRTGE